MGSWNTKVPKDPNNSADAIRNAIGAPPAARPGSGEPDDAPMRPLEQIHKDLGRHLPQTDGEPDMDPQGGR